MTTLSWLHLSDLHLLGTEEKNSVARARFDDLLGDIRKFTKDHGLTLDAVFFTGDVAFSGKKPQYDEAAVWFDEILDVCALSGKRDRLFLVPGNHDVDRDEVNPLIHADCAHRLLSEAEDYQGVNDFLSAAKDRADRERIFAALGSFARFTKDFLSDPEAKFDYNRCFCVRCIQKGSHTVVVIGLNSAWLSFGRRKAAESLLHQRTWERPAAGYFFDQNEQGKLLLGEIQVQDALKEARKNWPNASLRIALVHHPLYWLAEKDIHKVQQLLSRECEMLLHGHLHCSSFSVQSTPNAYLHSFAAGAGLKSKYRAYNIVALDLDTGAGSAFVRLQHDDIGPGWGPDGLTYPNAKDGRIDFSLLSGRLSGK